MKWFKKIRVMREMEGLKQGVFADELGILQKEVSVLESGGKKFLPERYITYLIDKNYDLNSLFDENLPLQKNSYDVRKVSEEAAVYDTKGLDNINEGKRDILITNLITEYNENNYSGIEGILNTINPNHLLHFIKDHIETLKKLDGFETIINNDSRFERIEASLGRLIIQFGEMKVNKD